MALNSPINLLSWTIRDLRPALASGTIQVAALAETALAHSNQNAGHNTYIWRDVAWARAEAARAEAIPRGNGGPFGDGRPALWGMPIAVKDLFDLAGSPTSCGTHFYRDLNGIATRDSWLVEQLRAAGAVIIGKTHLHPLAFGITGENPDYGDCVQPNDPSAFTGGSSSGAAASVQEGSAVAAIGTDTGGSIRVPAALCGLAAYRATLGRGDWRGGAHLAESFDTMGWFFRDLEDAPLLAAPFASSATMQTTRFTRFAFVDRSFLNDCDPQIIDSLHSVVRTLQVLGLESWPIDPEWWVDAPEIFLHLQCWEAAQIHAGNFDHFEPVIRERLRWGASLTTDEIAILRHRHSVFRTRMDELFTTNDLILLPCASVTRLAIGVDHSQTRSRLLRYRAPFSLAGVPTVVIPCTHGGVQLAAARGRDESLLQFAAEIGAQRKAAAHR
jgi:Asp-tRNA(Asn)/Glu-tRNA(Gln) amidotransferase A subunit family amidase